VLRRLVLDAERRRQIGLSSRAFVEKWHHPKVVGKMTTDAYRQALAKRQQVPAGSNRLRLLFKIARPTLRHFAVLYGNNSFPGLIARKISKLRGRQ
jgi:hypothetical protein